VFFVFDAIAEPLAVSAGMKFNLPIVGGFFKDADPHTVILLTDFSF
jgi:hypothetical protein